MSKLAPIALGVAVAALGLTTVLLFKQPVPSVAAQVEALRQELAAHITQSNQDAVPLLADHQRVLDEHDDLLARLRLDLNGVMMRKPPTVETRWIQNRFNRHEQRIGQLEYKAYGKPQK